MAVVKEALDHRFDRSAVYKYVSAPLPSHPPLSVKLY
jgi:hypothetical protein